MEKTNEERKVSDEALILLSEIKERISQGSITTIAKKVKKSRQTVYDFLNGKHEMHSKVSGKILDAIQELLDDASKKEEESKHKMKTIIKFLPEPKA